MIMDAVGVLVVQCVLCLLVGLAEAAHNREPGEKIDQVQQWQQTLNTSSQVIEMKLVEQVKDGKRMEKRNKLTTKKPSSVRVPRSVDCDSAPESPRNVTFSSHTVTQHSRRNRWRYTITWQRPESCGDPLRYITRFPNGGSSEVQVSNNSIDVYADGDEQVTFYVYAVYDGDRRSSAASTSIRTAHLRPQISPTDVSLSPDSPNCVTLLWQPPDFTNGAITGYQYTCDGGVNWITLGPKKRHHQVCAFEPYSSVRCQIKATNSAGVSNAASTYTKTLCAAPLLPADLSSYVTEEAYLPEGSEFHRRRIKINISPGDAKINCREIINTKCWFEGTDSGHAANETLGNLDALTTYTVLCQVTNDRNLQSQPQSVLVTTGELEPAAIEFSVMAANLTCVSVDWSKSQATNGIITSYQYRCSKTGGVTRTPFVDSTGKRTATSCGYERGDEVECEVRAATVIGFGPISSNKGTTRCTQPSVATIAANDSVYTNGTNQHRISLNIFWQAPLSNCDEVTNYTVVVGTAASNSTVQQALQDLHVFIDDLDPYTKYTIEVIAENNEGLVSKAFMEWLTSAASPFDAPIVNLNFNSSCAFLNISSPLVSNGVITHYKYFCLVTGQSEPPSPIVAEVSDQHSTQQQVCGFTSASSISCSVIAVNTAGESPAANLTGLTSLKLTDEMETSDLVKITDSDNTRTVELSVKPVQFENMAPTPLKYQILVTIEKHNNSTDSTFFDERFCDLKRMNEFAIARTLKQACYIAVEISSSILKPEGLTFVIGDDRLFGGYHNVPLEPDRNYSLMVAIILNLQNGKEYSFLLEPVSFYSSVQEDTKHFKTNEATCSDSCVTIISASLGSAAIGIILMCLWCMRARIKQCVSSRCYRKHAGAHDEEYIAIPNLPQHRPLPLPVPVQDVPLRPIDMPLPIGPVDTSSTQVIDNTRTYMSPDMRISKDIDVPSEKEKLLTEGSTHCGNYDKPSTSMAVVNHEKNIPLRMDRELNDDVSKPPPGYEAAKVDSEINGIDPESYTYVRSPYERLPPLTSPRECPIRRAFKSVEASLRSIQPTYTFANKECNHDKNRVLDILPDDEHLVHLESGQYINAVYVDSYDKKNHIIATQLPLLHTVKDFWEMIIQEKVKIVLQLDRNEEVEEVLYGSTDEMKIEVTADRTAKCLTKKSLTVNGCPVSVFLSGAWTAEDYYSDDVPDIDILLHHIEALGKHQEQSGDGKICVVDRDGCHRCGVFIAAYNMIIAMFKISNEEDLTIADAILKVRERRHQFLSDFQVHELIYKVHNHFREEYEADYEHFSVEMRLRDYMNVK